VVANGRQKFCGRSSFCHFCGQQLSNVSVGNGLQEKRMGDPALFDTICITATFLGIASVLVLSVLYLERLG